MSKIKKFLDFTKNKISDFINPKCNECGKELVDHAGSVGGLSPEPIYVCDNKECKKNINYENR
jgi:hypothetical protein